MHGCFSALYLLHPKQRGKGKLKEDGHGRRTRQNISILRKTVCVRVPTKSPLSPQDPCMSDDERYPWFCRCFFDIIVVPIRNNRHYSNLSIPSSTSCTPREIVTRSIIPASDPSSLPLNGVFAVLGHGTGPGVDHQTLAQLRSSREELLALPAGFEAVSG